MNNKSVSLGTQFLVLGFYHWFFKSLHHENNWLFNCKYLFVNKVVDTKFHGEQVLEGFSKYYSTCELAIGLPFQTFMNGYGLNVHGVRGFFGGRGVGWLVFWQLSMMWYYIFKEYLNYNNSFVRKRNDQVYVTTH